MLEYIGGHLQPPGIPANPRPEGRPGGIRGAQCEYSFTVSSTWPLAEHCSTSDA